MAHNDDESPFSIDKTRLDQEWLRQPKLTRTAGIRVAEADLAFNRAKAKLAVVDAQLTLAVRGDPEQYGLPEKRATDKTVASVVITQPEYQAALNALHDAEYAQTAANAEKFGMVDRRKALENLVELLTLDYFSEQEPVAATGRAREHIDRERRRAVREGGVDRE